MRVSAGDHRSPRPRRSSRHRPLHGTAAALVLVGLALGCGVPQSGEFEPISRDEIQFDLDATTTTSTTTTSTLPPTTLDETTTTALATTTVATEEVLLFFVAGSQLNPVPATLIRSPAPSQVLAKLVEGPPQGDIGAGLRTTIPRGASITVTRASGVGIIDLPADVFDAMPSRDQRLFFAQLVLTIGRLGGIGPVQFTRDGAPMSVIRGDGTTTEPGDAVSYDDYVVLLGGTPPSTTTSTTAPPPETTVAASPPDTGGG